MSSTTTSRKKSRQPPPRISTRSRKARSTVNSWWDRCANLERGIYAAEEALGQHAHPVSWTPARRAHRLYGLVPTAGIDTGGTALSGSTRDRCAVGPTHLCRE